MLTDRRQFLLGAGGTAVSLSRPNFSIADGRSPGRTIKAVALDGFAVIDARPIAGRAEAAFPGRGDALISAWRTRQFEYTWLRTMSGAYADFWQTTQDALIFAAGSLGLPLSGAIRDGLMHSYLELKAFDDARAALEALRRAGVRLAFLSNLTSAMLDAAVENSDMHGILEEHLSTDRVRAFKPDPRAYDMGLQAFRARRDEIAFCASAGWDAAGAKWFGYPTFWVNRGRQRAEELGVQPDGIGAGLADLVSFVSAS